MRPLVLFALLFGLLTIAFRDLSGHDSPRVAGIAREMALDGNLALPKLNGKPFLEYPPLGYWPQALSLFLVGSGSDFFALLPNVLWAVGTVLLTYLLGKRLANESVGLAAGFVLQLSMGFINLHDRCIVDGSLLFWITFSLYHFCNWCQSGYSKTSSACYFALGMSLACLSKGLIGVGLPSAVAVAYLLYQRDGSVWKKVPWMLGALCLVAPIALWAFLLYHEGGLILIGEVWKQSFERFAALRAEHQKPFYHYLLPVFHQLAPFTIALLLFFFPKYRPAAWKGSVPLPKGIAFPAIWFLTVLLVLSAASSKRLIYLAPLYPAFALMAGFWWEGLKSRIAAQKYLEFKIIGAATALMLTVDLGFILPRDQEDSLKPLFEIVQKEAGESSLWLYDSTETLSGAAVFYLGKKIPEGESLEDFRAWRTGQTQRAYFIVRDSVVGRIKPVVPPDHMLLLGQGNAGSQVFQLYALIPEKPR